MISAALLASTKAHEGYRARAYQDTKGIWTIGYGTNLQELQIDDELAETWLYDKLNQAETSAGGFPWFSTLSDVRQDVVVEMIYNLGLPRFAKFSKMILALAEHKYNAAAVQMLDSEWHKQVGKRAERLATQMISGEYWLVA